jgi:hypothetical protein
MRLAIDTLFMERIMIRVYGAGLVHECWCWFELRPKLAGKRIFRFQDRLISLLQNVSSFCRERTGCFHYRLILYLFLVAPNHAAAFSGRYRRQGSPV